MRPKTAGTEPLFRLPGTHVRLSQRRPSSTFSERGSQRNEELIGCIRPGRREVPAHNHCDGPFKGKVVSLSLNLLSHLDTELSASSFVCLLN